VVLAVADQVGAAHGPERVAQQRPVVRVAATQEGLVQAAALVAAHDATRSPRSFPRRPLSGLQWYETVAVVMGPRSARQSDE
jgi:hypothetical protein